MALLTAATLCVNPLTGTTTLHAQGAATTPAVDHTLAAFPAELKARIKHVIIVYPENRSFDSLYGKVPGVNGIAQARAENVTQTDRAGRALDSLPRPTTSGIPGLSAGPDTRFPAATPNAQYDAAPFVPFSDRIGDMVHRFYTEQYQINDKTSRFRSDPQNAGGAPMSKMSAWSDNPGLVMNYYDAQNLGEGALAREYTLADNCFHSAFGGSFLNHQYLIAARAPVWPAAPTDGGSPPPAGTGSDTVFNSRGFPTVLTSGSLSDGAITGDGDLPAFVLSNAFQTIGTGDYWAVNTLRPLRGPAGGFSTADTGATAPASDTPISGRLPLQTFDTIGDRLDAAGISWAWYGGGWNDAKAGRADYLFQFHHQPFAFFAKYALATTPVAQTATKPAVAGTDSPGSAAHLKDEDADFYPAIVNGTLPTVSFVKPVGENNSHPGYASVQRGQDWLNRLANIVESSQYANDTVILDLYDEHGGLFDHVQPPRVDAWGPGLRIPFLVIAPFVKKGFVDHTQYETVSVLSFVEGLFDLPPLNTRDADAQPPISAFPGQPDLIIRGYVGKPVSYQMPGYNRPTFYKVRTAAGPVELDGLSLDPATGILTGEPQAEGSYLIPIKIRGEDGTVKYTARLDVRAREYTALLKVAKRPDADHPAR